ncbi:tumor necrosis factor receptor superfamily member 16-like isoform X2 [Ptychodera flava]
MIITKLALALPINVEETTKCFNSECPAGYHMDVARITAVCQSNEIHCIPCKDGTFTAVPNTHEQCFPHRSCNANAKVTRPGTKAEDTTCQCINHTLSVSGACVPWKKCGVGERVLILGNSTSDVVCEDCPNGTFSDTKDWSTTCRKHTRCQEYGWKTLMKGSRINDTICYNVSEQIPNTESSSTKSSDAPHNNHIIFTHPSGETTEDVTAVTKNSTESEHQHFEISSVGYILLLVAFPITIIAVACLVTKYRNRRQNARKSKTDRRVAAYNRGPNHDRQNSRHQKPIQNRIQKGHPDGDVHPKPKTVAYKPQSDVSGNCAGNRGESGTSHRGEVANSDMEDDTHAKPIAQTEEPKQGMDTTENTGDNGENSPLVVQCTDPKGNIGDLDENKGNHAFSKMSLREQVLHTEQKHPLLQNASNMTGYGSDVDSESDADPVNTEVSRV